jgi:hypothetical protein
MVYEAGSDSWSELALPPHSEHYLLSAYGPTVAAYLTTQENGVRPDLLYDAGDDAWTELPPDPLQPSFDRTLVGTPAGAVLFGIESVEQPGVEPSIYRAALLRDGRWTRLPDSEVVGWNPMWSLVGDRLVNINIDKVDGGETNNYGRFYLTGGIFDLGDRSWRDLRGIPEAHGGFDGIYAAGERYVVSGQGWVFDAIEERWIELSRPPEAPEAEAAATWTGDRLAVWGGVRWDRSDGQLLNEGWLWSPSN